MPCSARERDMMKHTVLLIAMAILFVGCGTMGQRPFRPAVINHLVFFSLLDPEERYELIEDCDSGLSAIGGIVSYWCGEHGEFGRSKVDGDYDVGLYVGFDSNDAYNQYLNHPNHLSLVEKWKNRWGWIRIHDVVDETP